MNKLKKAVTFSYDDAPVSDIKFVELLNKYNLRCTFNLNSGNMDKNRVWNYHGFDVYNLPPDEMKQLYAGHEIACHGSKHIKPINLSENELKKEFYEDKVALEKLFDTKIEGAAYSYGVCDEATVNYLKKLGIKYARVTQTTKEFSLKNNLLEFEGSCRNCDEDVFETIDKFLNLETDEPQIFYMWGHTYELDARNEWDKIESIFNRLSGKYDIFYGTNAEVFRYFDLI